MSQESDSPLLAHRTKIAALGAEVLKICELDLQNATELQRQILAGYLFGITYTHCSSQGLTPADTHALAITMLVDVVQYDAKQAAAFVSGLINATQAGDEDTMKSIIIGGLEGYRLLALGEHGAVRGSLLGIFNILQPPQAS